MKFFKKKNKEKNDSENISISEEATQNLKFDQESIIEDDIDLNNEEHLLEEDENNTEHKSDSGSSDDESLKKLAKELGLTPEDLEKPNLEDFPDELDESEISEYTPNMSKEDLPYSRSVKNILNNSPLNLKNKFYSLCNQIKGMFVNINDDSYLKRPSAAPKFSPQKIFSEVFFSNEHLRTFHHLSLIGISIAGAWGTGKLGGIIADKILPNYQIIDSNYSATSPLKVETGDILSANIFASRPSSVEKVKDPNKKSIKKKIIANRCDKDSSIQTNISAKLLFTTVLQDTKKSIATVKISSKDIEDLREGDQVIGKFKLTRILENKILLINNNNGQCEFMRNTADGTSFKSSPVSKQSLGVLSPKIGKKLMSKSFNDNVNKKGNNYNIKKSYRDELLKDINSLLKQARAVPVYNPDGSLSFKIEEIVPGSFFSMLDIQNGDYINELNGKKFKSVNDVMAFFGKIKKIDQFELGYTKNGQQVTKSYLFE